MTDKNCLIIADLKGIFLVLRFEQDLDLTQRRNSDSDPIRLKKSDPDLTLGEYRILNSLHHGTYNRG